METELQYNLTYRDVDHQAGEKHRTMRLTMCIHGAMPVRCEAHEFGDGQARAMSYRCEVRHGRYRHLVEINEHAGRRMHAVNRAAELIIRDGWEIDREHNSDEDVLIVSCRVNELSPAETPPGAPSSAAESFLPVPGLAEQMAGRMRTVTNTPVPESTPSREWERIAKAAYEEYNRSAGIEVPMAWERKPERMREAWIDAVQAVCYERKRGKAGS